jgi:serine/threonine protein kinase
VKPENFIFEIVEGKINICVIDFEFATNKKISRSHCGTEGFIAPEMKTGFFDPKAADVFSLGKTFEFLLQIFETKNQSELLRQRAEYLNFQQFMFEKSENNTAHK